MKDPWIWALSPERAENSPRFFLRFDTIKTVRTCEVLGFRGEKTSLIISENRQFSGKVPEFLVHIERTTARFSQPSPVRHIQARGIQTTPRAWLFFLNSLKQAELTASLSVLSPLSRKAITSPKNRIFNAGTHSFSLPSSTQVQRPISGLTPSK